MKSFDEYCNQEKDNEVFQTILTKIRESGKLDVFKNIISINPYYRITDFDSNFFNDENIKAYGYENLLSLQNRIDPKLLRISLKEEELKERLIYFATFEPRFDIKLEHLHNLAFSPKFLDYAKKNFDSFELVCFIKFIYFASDKEIEELVPLLENEEQLFKLKYLLTHTKELLISHILYNKDIITSNEGTIFIKSLIASNFDILLSPNKLIGLFHKYKKLFTDERLIKSNVVSIFLKDDDRDQYNIKSPDDLLHYLMKRSVHHRKSDSETLIKVKLGGTPEEIKERIKNYLVKNQKYKFLKYEEVKKLMNIGISPDDRALLDSVELKYREMCKKTIVSHLYVPNKEDLTNMNFRAIIHQVRFNSPSLTAKRFEMDPRTWDSNQVLGAYISGSLINHYSLGTIGTKKENLIGFSKLDSSDILDMGLDDIYSSIYYYYANLKNPHSDFRTIEDFDQSLGCAYNEVTLRRFKNGISLKPDFTLAFDEITDFNRSMKEYFNIPIRFIDSMRSAEAMNNHNLSLLLSENIHDYAIYLYKFYTSYMNNPEIMERFFNKKDLECLINIIINDYKSLRLNCNKTSILFLLTIIEKINQGLTYNADDSKAIDVEDFRKKLEK